MEGVKEDRYTFSVAWHDRQADLIRNYLLTFYPSDNSIDMVSPLHYHCYHPVCSILIIFVSFCVPFIVRFEKQAVLLEEDGVPDHRDA